MINLYINYYKDKNLERQKEIDYCFYKNISNENLNVIILDSQARVTFKMFFDKINKITFKNDINIIANSDIFFDESLNFVNNIKDNECYALSRWDLDKNGQAKHFNRADSQDTWIIKGFVKKNMFGDFNMGFRGCDNRLAYEFEHAGYKILNPSLTIKTYHLHNTGIRNYNMSPEFLVPKPYLTVNPVSL